MMHFQSQILEYIGEAQVQEALVLMKEVYDEWGKIQQVEFHQLSSRYVQLQEQIDSGTISYHASTVEFNRIVRSLINFVQEELHNQREGIDADSSDNKYVPVVFNVKGKGHIIQLRFLSRRLEIDDTFAVSAEEQVSTLKQALIHSYQMDTRVKPGYDTLDIHVWANHQVVQNESLSLREAGISEGDIVQIQFVYRKEENMVFGPLPYYAAFIDFQCKGLHIPTFILDRTYKGNIIYQDPEKKIYSVAFEHTDLMNKGDILPISILSASEKYAVFDPIDAVRYETYNDSWDLPLRTFTDRIDQIKYVKMKEVLEKYSFHYPKVIRRKRLINIHR